MVSIATKIKEAKSILELDDVICGDNLTDVETGYCFDRLCGLTTSGCSNSQTGQTEGGEEVEDIVQYWMRAGSPVLSNSQNEVLEGLMDGGNGEEENEEIRKWRRCESPVTQSQELILERAIAEASKSTAAEAEASCFRNTGARKKGALPSRDLVREKQYYDGIRGKTTTEKIEKEVFIVDEQPQSPPGEVIALDESEDSALIRIIRPECTSFTSPSELPRQTAANQTPPEEHEIIDLTDEDWS